MNISNHAVARGQQRSIPPFAKEILVALGNVKPAKEGNWEIYLSKKRRGRAVTHLKRLVSKLEKSGDVRMIVSNDFSTVVTFLPQRSQ